MENTVLQLIDQYYVATTESDKQTIKNELFFQHYYLSAEQRTNVWTAMQPFFDEIEQEMIEKDPVARQTYEMFKRFAASKTVAERWKINFMPQPTD